MTISLECLTSRWFASPGATKTIFVAHGRGDSLEGFLWLPNALGLKVNYLMVNAPDDYYGGYSWYDLPPHQEQGILRSCNLLDTAFSELEAQGISSSDIIYFGFSQGCLMGLEWGGRTHRRLAGIVGISGYCFDEEVLNRERGVNSYKTPWFVSHGRFDSVLDFAKSQGQIQFLMDADWPISFHAYEKDHTIDPDLEIVELRSFVTKLLETTC